MLATRNGKRYNHNRHYTFMRRWPYTQLQWPQCRSQSRIRAVILERRSTAVIVGKVCLIRQNWANFSRRWRLPADTTSSRLLSAVPSSIFHNYETPPSKQYDHRVPPIAEFSHLFSTHQSPEEQKKHFRSVLRPWVVVSHVTVPNFIVHANELWSKWARW